MSTEQHIENIPIADINVKGRIRQDAGNLDDLAKSIESVGLLHPVVLTQDYKLIVGGRRIAAFLHLKRDTIPAIIVSEKWELAKLLEAEGDENTCRKALTPEEAVHLGQNVEKAFADMAKAKQKAGGGDKKSSKAKSGGVNPPTLIPEPQDEGARTKAQAAAVAGMERKAYTRAEEVVASGNRKLIDEMNRTSKVAGAWKKLKTSEKAEAINAEPPPLPDGQFRVIVADPPWSYDSRGNDPTHRAANPYPSMTIDEIKALPVASHAHDNSVLWLWTTNAHLREAFAVAEAWGFKFKTMLTWGKNKMGLGDWLRGQTEHCLLCVRGKPTIQLTNQTTLLLADAGKHSAKPDTFYTMVEALCPGSRLEMFQRTPKKGWVAHGSESK